MLRLPPFRYLRPASLAEACRAVAGEGAAEGLVRPVAGGTDLWPNMKRRHQKADTVVSLGGVGELGGIDVPASGGDARLGATATLADIAAHGAIRERWPALARAVESISSPPLRNQGTIGGNVCVDTRCTYYNQTEEWRRAIGYCMKEEGEICWVATSSPRCWAHSASDAAPMLAALGASVQLVSAGSNGGGLDERVVPVDALYADDGIEYLAKRPEELVAEVRVPAAAAAGRRRQSFWKLRRRGSIDFAVVSAAVALETAGDGTVEDARIFLGAVASRPAAATKAAEVLIGEKPDRELIRQAARLARRVATPMDNTDFKAQWRGTMVERYVEAALAEALGLELDRLPPNHAL